MKNQHSFTLIELLIVLFGLLTLGGWMSNIAKLAWSSFDPITGIVVLRIIGVFVVPLGAVLGFL